MGITTGSSGNPTISQGQGNTIVTVQDNAYFDFTISGDGKQATPYTITATKQATAPAPAVAVNHQVFTLGGIGIWTRPFTDGWCLVRVWGGGGGGGGSDTSGSHWPGYGGAGGGYSERQFLLDELPETVGVVVGLGGAGGAGAPDSSSTGKQGVSGQTSAFGTYVYAGGGVGGWSGFNTSRGGYGTELGGQGGIDPTNQNTAWLQATGAAGAGGGMGGYAYGFEPSAALRDGQDGGLPFAGGFVIVGTGGKYSTDTEATPGNASTFNDVSGGAGGGGGRGGGNGHSRGNGAAGGPAGGGGGGGGAGISTGGAGGPGGVGKVVVTSWQGVTP